MEPLHKVGGVSVPKLLW